MRLISGCFGEFNSADKICNGDKESLDSEDRKPCEWRNRCKAFKKYLEESERSLGDFLKAVDFPDEDGTMYEAVHGFPQFASFCDRLVERYTKKRKKQAEVDRRKYGPSPRAMQAASKALGKRAKIRKAELEEWIGVVVDDFANQLKNKRFATAGIAIPVGQFYLIDRLDSSDYLAICYRTETGHDNILARIFRKTLRMNYDVWFSFTVSQLQAIMSKRDFKRWKPEDKIAGKINSKIRDLNKADLAIIAGLLARAVNKGQFPPQESD